MKLNNAYHPDKHSYTLLCKCPLFIFSSIYKGQTQVTNKQIPPTTS